MKRQPVQKILFPAHINMYVQDNGDGTWTAMIRHPFGDGNPYDASDRESAILRAAEANGFRRHYHSEN